MSSARVTGVALPMREGARHPKLQGELEVAVLGRLLLRVQGEVLDEGHVAAALLLPVPG